MTEKRISRRTLIAGSAAGGVLITGLGVGLSRLGGPDAPSGTDDDAVPVPSTQLQIVAHPDDDLMFFAPDSLRAIDGGAKLITVCLTAGEGDGRNVDAYTPAVAIAPVRYGDYAAARYDGLRAAYAKRATGDPNSAWQREALPVAGGAVAELCTLEAAPQIQVILLNMRELADGSTLRTLWEKKKNSQPVLRIPGSPVTASRAFSRASLIRSLADLLERYQPTLVRTMDPDPDRLVHNESNAQFSDFGYFSDQTDHTPAGLFAWAAVQEWCRKTQRRTVVQSYRGNYNRRWPANLGPGLAREKIDYLNVYGEHDRKSGRQVSLIGNGQSTTSRYALSTAWLGRGGKDKRLAAFGVRGGRAVHWSETEAGSGAWLPPTVLSGEGLLPHLAAAQLKDGRWQVFGVRAVLGATEAQQRREVMTAVQRAPGEAFGPWANLGNPVRGSKISPEGAVPVWPRGLGMPVVAANKDGRLQLFVRTFTGAVHTRTQTAAGDWGPWVDLRGSQTQDGLTAITTGGGRIEVLAARQNGIARWLQRSRNVESFRRSLIDVPAPAGPPTVLKVGDGRLMILVREALTGRVLAYQQQGDNRQWSGEAVDLGGHGGFGPVAGVGYRDNMVAISQRNDDGTTSLTLRYLDALHEGDWKRTGPVLASPPALSVDASGHLVLAAICADGRLRVTRQEQPGPTMSLRSWVAVEG
ncbi:LmbE family N-acetylglucosaminyl deacetylase [Actinoplanes lutulentus]|uniref:GlcNAc-PI de-N-acetylase n=1 Tax=Actinoplanes lutulentus TaxID=1287878 RepID=A0A327Z6V4_9ACTN|nr:PIG-L family deacetylase [Actinoplanes lutulentus]MBB2944963.1 LmbE family N-acetylglucosaminyl deacetylase [Actinoplanes lutulentus]RAK31757.1 GlcNAc-PI de-N-acetylase [Actinoplanes lutulentus]